MEQLFAWWNRTPLYQRIVGGMVLGVFVGMAMGPQAESLAIPSKLVLRVLGALAPPLILLAIVQALITTKFDKGTAPRLIRLLALNTIVAISVGLLVANVIRPGRSAHLAAEGATFAAKDVNILQQFLDNVPKSLVGPLTDDGKVIGVILIALVFGLALRKHLHSPVPIVAWVDLALKTLITVLHWVIAVVPLAVFGLVASIIGSKGFGAFHALGLFVIAVITALLIQACYYLLRIRFASWVRPFALLKGGRDALVMGFSTGSSTVTMPVTFECLWKRVGLREKSATLGAFVGSNFNNDGTALYEAMAALFVAQLLGMHLTIVQQLMVVITSVVASVGAAGIPEAGLVTMTLVFHSVGLPIEYIAFLLPVDWFLDRCRTSINIMGDMNVACILDGKTQGTEVERAVRGVGGDE